MGLDRIEQRFLGAGLVSLAVQIATSLALSGDIGDAVNVFTTGFTAFIGGAWYGYSRWGR